jgi:outer membrane protein assembly factor BamB
MKTIGTCLIAGLLDCAGVVMAVEVPATQVLKESGVTAGLAVVIGTTDGALEAGLIHEGKMLVQGLALSNEAAARARKFIFEKKLYGLASVSVVKTSATLPYYDRLVNLLVADLDALGKDAPSKEEIDRVLGYEGVAYLKKGGAWAKTVKPTPKEVDAWTHFCHDASGNPVSKDLVVGPPNTFRWADGPFGRNLIGGLRTSDGVAVQINPAYNERLLANRSSLPAALRGLFLWARDVNSGVLLWRRKVAEGGDSAYSWNYANTFVAAGGRVYGFDFTAEDRIALTAWHLRTGDVARVFDKGVVCRKADYPGGAQKGRGWQTWANETFAWSTVLVHADKVVHAVKDKLVVMDAGTGNVVWKQEAKDARYHRALISGDRVVALLAKVEDRSGRAAGASKERASAELVAAEAWQLKDGRPLWRSDLNGLWFPSDTLGLNFGAQDLHLLLPVTKAQAGKGQALILMDAKDGSRVWEKPTGSGPMGLCIIKDKIWIGTYGSSPFGGVLSLATGDRDPTPRKGGMNQSACDGPTATLNWFMGKRNFIPVDPKPDSYQWLALRPMGKQCGEKAAASYGSVFAVSVYCYCDHFIRGTGAFYAVYPTTPIPDGQRLTKGGGIAAGAVDRQTEAQKSLSAFAWGKPEGVRSFWGVANFRGGAEHPALLGYESTQTAPVQAGDLTLLAYPHEHRLAATRDGREIWNAVAGARIGSAPVLYGNLALFGSHDGYVYAVNVKDGTRAWRFLAAPADRRHMFFGQIESAWPVFNVVLDGGTAYVSAGRHEELDGGIHFYGLDAATGAMKWHVQRRRGYESDRGPMRVRKTGHGLTYVSERESNVPYDDRALLNDAIEVRDGKIFLFKKAVVDVAAPKDEVRLSDALVPPQFPK